ncbi:hypothetical protein H5410_015502 [Solanum commersonii]|uniref:Uncharacterized protein n=1 Tax=Solanum commersonii TaxID=4109 RepID=A0A9J5ZTV4_SOLCO|nr:hypothetical protein H5410_015502 [Solanum commersonii]
MWSTYIHKTRHGHSTKAHCEPTLLMEKCPPPPPPPPPQSPPPSSPAPSPPCVHKEATPTADTEILRVYGSSAPIHLVNAPPRKRGSLLNAGEGTSVVRAKRPNVEAFGAAAAESVNIGPFGPNLKCSFPSIQHVSPLSMRSID